MDKIINLLINNWIKGVDTYIHNGSTWLIFTEQKSWVIELTESKTLWYNYNFFKELFSLTSMDVVENQHYITKWVEDNIINGVKVTITSENRSRLTAENIIENGVKHTEKSLQIDGSCVIEDTIENGVRHTLNTEYMPTSMVEDIIQNGVKETKYNQSHQEPKFKEVLKYGVIMSNPRQYVTNKIIDDTIQNGIKETKTPGKDGDILSTIEWMEENNSNSYSKMIDDVIENGVKETKVCNFLDPNTNLVYVRWPEDIEEVIDYGTKNPSV